MSQCPDNPLGPIWFEDELLPGWAHILDLGATLARAHPDTRRWFTRFSRSSGVDDSRTVTDKCKEVLAGIQSEREFVLAALSRDYGECQAALVLSAWRYSLDTMVQVADSHPVCSWTLEESDDAFHDGSDGGDVTLRRV